jgi:hypothetical protein
MDLPQSMQNLEASKAAEEPVETGAKAFPWEGTIPGPAIDRWSAKPAPLCR